VNGLAGISLDSYTPGKGSFLSLLLVCVTG